MDGFMALLGLRKQHPPPPPPIPGPVPRSRRRRRRRRSSPVMIDVRQYSWIVSATDRASVQETAKAMAESKCDSATLLEVSVKMDNVSGHYRVIGKWKGSVRFDCEDLEYIKGADESVDKVVIGFDAQQDGDNYEHSENGKRKRLYRVTTIVTALVRARGEAKSGQQQSESRRNKKRRLKLRPEAAKKPEGSQ